MKRMMVVIALGLLAIATNAQFDERDRLVSNNPLRNGDGSFMRANNVLFNNNTSVDTTWSKKRKPAITTNGDPFVFRVTSVQVLCDLNSVQFNWTSLQRQPDADRFEIEQSADAGITWTNIGTVPANRHQNGNDAYNFVYNKSLGSVDVRIAAVNRAGERRYSAIVRSACSNTNLLSVDNLVYSTAKVRIGSVTTQTVRMILTNSYGDVVQAMATGLTQGVNSISIDMSNRKTGVYMLTIIWPGGAQQSVKVVKQ